MVAVAAVLVATLWPLNPRPRNGVTWLQQRNGLKFEKAGMVLGSAPLKIPDDAQSFTLELLVQPNTIVSSHAILSFCSVSCSRQFQIQQWQHALLLTHDPRHTEQVGRLNLFVGHVFRPGELAFISITDGPSGTKVYVNGELVQSSPNFKISREDLSGEFMIGSSPVAYHPWSGELLGIAVYATELDRRDLLRHYQFWTDSNRQRFPPDLRPAVALYTFREGRGAQVQSEVAFGPTLRIPPSFSVPHKPLLQAPVEEFKRTRSYLWDMVSNVAGFIPLGVIVCSYLSWTRTRPMAVLTATAFCGVLSFAIEVMQFFIPTRGSGITDIVTNTLGAAVGALLVQSSVVSRTLGRMGILPTAAQR